MYKFSLTMSLTEYRKLVYFNTFFKKEKKIKTLLIVGIAILLLVINLFTKKLNILASLGSLALVFMFMFSIALEFSLRNSVKSGSTLVGRKQEFSIDENGINVFNEFVPEGEMYLWDSVTEYYDLKDCIYIYTNNGQILAIIKNQIDDKFKDTILEKLTNLN